MRLKIGLGSGKNRKISSLKLKTNYIRKKELE